MNVDFNNLRLSIQENFNNIMSMLHGGSYNVGNINMDYNEVIELQEELDDLRNNLATLMCIYTDDSNNIADQANLSTLSLTEE